MTPRVGGMELAGSTVLILGGAGLVGEALAPFRDRVVHHALCNVIEPLFDRTFIFDSYACRSDNGTHAAVERYSAFAGKVLKLPSGGYSPPQVFKFVIFVPFSIS